MKKNDIEPVTDNIVSTNTIGDDHRMRSVMPTRTYNPHGYGVLPNPTKEQPTVKLWAVVCALIPALMALITPKGLAIERKAVWAGSFYPDEPSELVQRIDADTRMAMEAAMDSPKGRLKALILPHAGYIYSGQVAAFASRVLSGVRYDRVIVMGPDHRIGFSGVAVSDVTAYQTPLGAVPLDYRAEQLRRFHPDLFHSVPASDEKEHSIEVQLPFLTRYIGDFHLIPMVMGDAPVKTVVDALDPLLDSQTLWVVSSDLSHYLPYEAARIRDLETIDAILSLNADALRDQENAACGIGPIRALIAVSKKHGWKPALLRYANSGDTAGDRSRVVGYAAIAFSKEDPEMGKEENPQTFTTDQGQQLVRLARETLLAHFGKGKVTALSDIKKDPAFNGRQGTFVTLEMNGELRGCIGSLSSSDPIFEGVQDNAINAAFHDFRFSPLTAKELERVVIEVSILTEPKPLAYRNPEDLLTVLRPGIDGVIIKKDGARATFLPQVWEQLQDPKDFLEHLCRKAGLSADAWRRGNLEVSTYQVQHFKESQ